MFRKTLVSDRRIVTMLSRMFNRSGRRRHNPILRGSTALTSNRNRIAIYNIIAFQQGQPNQPSKGMSRSFHATSCFSTTHLTHLKGLVTEAPHLVKGLTKPPKMTHIPCTFKSSDTSHKTSHYLAVKFAGGEIIYCELKPLVNFHEDDLFKKLQKEWCALCDLKPVEKKGGGVLEGKLIGAVEWDGERFKSILKEHLNLEKNNVKFLEQELHHIGEQKEEVGSREAEELVQLEQVRLELEEAAVKKVNLLEWALLFGLATIMGVFIRLTWWDWDWDAVEPFSFVFMFSLLIASFAYFLLTKKDLTYQGARRRVMNMLFTREAQRSDFNSKRFKELAKKKSQ